LKCFKERAIKWRVLKMRFIIIVLTVLSFYTQVYASDFPAKEVYAKFSPSVVVIKASKEGAAG